MAAEYNITHDKGTTFKLFALYKDSSGSVIDLNNYTARMQVRRSPNDSGVALFITGATMNGVSGVVRFKVGPGMLSGSVRWRGTGTKGMYVKGSPLPSNPIPSFG